MNATATQQSGRSANSFLPQNKLETFAQRGIIGSDRILLSQHKVDDMV
ncbi:hypothetical protein [Pseudoalteromonas sp. J010]|nr:hypothetical protein [Pseudoalteromonas sp. J010]